MVVSDWQETKNVIRRQNATRLSAEIYGSCRVTPSNHLKKL